jgi:transcriptional regulator with XRE-family HTH domain
MTQNDLAVDAEVSCKHLSFLEAGRARPSRRMVLRLAGCLDVPLRDRNVMLAAAGFDPEFQERRFSEPAFDMVRRDVEAVLAAHEPYPAFAVDRHWQVLATNRAAATMFAGAELALLRPPLNLLRLCLHPAGIASHIVNLAQWRGYLIARLRRQMDATGDSVLADLLEEIRDYPLVSSVVGKQGDDDIESLIVPLRLAAIDGVLTFLNTSTTFGAAADITLAEITIEAFLPGNARTQDLMQTRLADQDQPVLAKAS